MNLSKAFYCISLDLLIAKLAAFGLNRNLVRYIYTYLEKKESNVFV